MLNQKRVPSLSPRELCTCAAFVAEGATYRQIAVRFGVSEWAIRKRVLRARRKLAAQGLALPKRCRPGQCRLLAPHLLDVADALAM